MPKGTRISKATKVDRKHNTRAHVTRSQHSNAEANEVELSDDAVRDDVSSSKARNGGKLSKSRIRPRVASAISMTESSLTRPAHRTSDGYKADDEQTPGRRRFSDLYGHGHPLNDSTMPSPPQSPKKLSGGRKRSTPDTSGSPSPKKVRFDRDSNETRQIQEGKIASIPLSPYPITGLSGVDVRSQAKLPLPSKPTILQLDTLIKRPAPLGLGNLAELFHLLQDETEAFARHWFGCDPCSQYEVIYHDEESFPIHDLEYKHPALYRIVVWVLDAAATDGDISGLLKFFVQPSYRKYLVFAILGEWFSQRIFKDPTFGLSTDATNDLEKLDKEYFHFDAFIRAKKRSELINGHLDIGENLIVPKPCNDLVNELLVLLAPLMPIVESSDQSEIARHRANIKRELLELVEKCAALNLSILLTGSNGTVVRIAQPLQKGRAWSRFAPMDPINREVFEEKPGRLSQQEKLVIRMTCWARVEAYVPHGMDMLQMKDMERKAIEAAINDEKETEDIELSSDMCDRALKKFCWDCPDYRDAFEVLPEELWEYAITRTEKQENKIRSYDMRLKLERSQKAKAPSSHGGGGDSDPEPSDSDDDADLDNDRSPTSDSDEDSPRGTWVTIYDRLVPHKVYIEWTKPVTQDELKLKREQAALHDQSMEQFDSLHETVRRARQIKALSSHRVKFDDARLILWNLYANHNVSIEWALVAVFFLARSKLGHNLGNAVVKAIISVSSLAKGGVSLTGDALLGLIQHLASLSKMDLAAVQEHLQRLVEHRWEDLKNYWHAILTTLTDLLPKPSSPETIDKLSPRTSHISTSPFVAALGSLIGSGALLQPRAAQHIAPITTDPMHTIHAVNTAIPQHADTSTATTSQAGFFNRLIHGNLNANLDSTTDGFPAAVHLNTAPQAAPSRVVAPEAKMKSMITDDPAHARVLRSEIMEEASERASSAHSRVMEIAKERSREITQHAAKVSESMVRAASVEADSIMAGAKPGSVTTLSVEPGDTMLMDVKEKRVGQKARRWFGFSGS